MIQYNLPEDVIFFHHNIPEEVRIFFSRALPWFKIPSWMRCTFFFQNAFAIIQHNLHSRRSSRFNIISQNTFTFSESLLHNSMFVEKVSLRFCFVFWKMLIQWHHMALGFLSTHIFHIRDTTAVWFTELMINLDKCHATHVEKTLSFQVNVAILYTKRVSNSDYCHTRFLRHSVLPFVLRIQPQ